MNFTHLGLRALLVSILLLLCAPATAKSKKHCKLPCKQPTICVRDIKQSDIPIVITEPGLYRVCSNIIWGGNGPAIKFLNVTGAKLEYCVGVKIVLTGFNSTGIEINNSQDISLINDPIINMDVSNQTVGNGILITNSSEAIAILNDRLTDCGIRIEKSSRVFIDTTTIGATDTTLPAGLSISQSENVTMRVGGIVGFRNDPDQTGVEIDGSSIVTFDQVIFERNSFHIYCSHSDMTPNNNITIQSSQFYNPSVTNLVVEQVDALTIENSTFTMNSIGSLGTFPLNYAEFGTTEYPQEVSDINIINTTFKNSRSDLTSFEGLVFTAGTGFLIRNTKIFIDNRGEDPLLTTLAGIHFQGWQNGLITNTSRIDGFPNNGILGEPIEIDSTTYLTEGIIIQDTIIQSPVLRPDTYGIRFEGIDLTLPFAKNILVGPNLGNNIFNFGTGVYFNAITSSTIVNNGIVGCSTPIDASTPVQNTNITIQNNTITP